MTLKTLPFKLIVKDSFDAAHQLYNHKGKCQYLHGHTYHVEIHFWFENIDNDKESSTFGMAQDFAVLKIDTKAVLDTLDHRFLNDVFGDNPATAEHIAMYIFDRLSKFGYHNPTVYLWETPKFGVKYPA